MIAWAAIKLFLGSLIEPIGKILKAIPWQAWALAGLVLAFWWYGGTQYDRGYEKAEGEYKALIDKMALDATQALADAKDKARQAERAAVEEQARIAEQLIAERNQAYEERDRVIDDLRAGNRRLQQRFTCPPASGSGRVPATAAATGRSDGTGQAGLSGQDAEFLIREAGRADAAVRQLQACQAVVRSHAGQQ